MLQRRKAFDHLADFQLREPQFVQILQVEPEFRCGAEEMREAQSSVSRNGPLTVEDLRDTVSRHTDFAGKFCSAHAKCIEFFGQVLTWVDWCHWHNISPSDNQQFQRSRGPAILPATQNISATGR